MTALPPLHELWRHVVLTHSLLKAYGQDAREVWTRARNRKAWDGLAILAALLRRLIHLMACEVPLAPHRPPAEEPAAPRPPSARRRPRLAFRLIETPRERPRRAQNPDRLPETPELARARFLDRLSTLARVYRERGRLARRLARRVQSGRAPLRALPAKLETRLGEAVTGLLARLTGALRRPPLENSS